MTTANACWMRCAEDRDRKQSEFDTAIADAFPWVDDGAVAELIEAAKVAEKELPELCQASEMLRAALSRCGGAK